jgi:hypoxanthine-guanine phosphoribosyltransferase
MFGALLTHMLLEKTPTTAGKLMFDFHVWSVADAYVVGENSNNGW